MCIKKLLCNALICAGFLAIAFLSTARAEFQEVQIRLELDTDYRHSHVLCKNKYGAHIYTVPRSMLRRGKGVIKSTTDERLILELKDRYECWESRGGIQMPSQLRAL